MATHEALTTVTLVATADLSSWQYKAVKLTSGTNRGCEPADADNDPSIGILQNAPASGEAAQVAIGGISKAKFGATLAVGAAVECQATSGEMIANTTGGYAIGLVVEAAADGETGSILVIPSAEATA